MFILNKYEANLCKWSSLYKIVEDKGAFPQNEKFGEAYGYFNNQKSTAIIKNDIHMKERNIRDNFYLM
jgi:hypothetical protein